jgi:hypothetical protein
MELRSGNRKLDPYRPTFDPGLDVATVVFSHVRCVKTRFNLSLVSKLWRDASKPAAAYPDRFDFDAFTESWRRHGDEHILDKWRTLITRMLDNDEALSLPYERVVGLLGGTANFVWCFCNRAASRGSVRLLKWARENNIAWDAHTCYCAAKYGHLPALQYLHENGCPWDWETCYYAALRKQWDCVQYAVDNKCPGWKEFAEHLR